MAVLPFFSQETPYSCVPACLRMGLAHFGIEASEDEVRRRAYTTLWGTNARDAVACIRSFGLLAEEKKDASLVDLHQWLAGGLFPILLIDLRPLHNEAGRHAIVAEAVTDDELIYLDPLAGRRVMALGRMDQAWRLNRCRAILIWPG